MRYDLAAFVGTLNDFRVVIGPMVYRLTDGTSPFVDYFMVGTMTEAGFDITRFESTPEERSQIIDKLTHKVRPKLELHLCDDELTMIDTCATLWPCEKTLRLRYEVMAEKAGLRKG